MVWRLSNRMTEMSMRGRRCRPPEHLKKTQIAPGRPPRRSALHPSRVPNPSVQATGKPTPSAHIYTSRHGRSLYPLMVIACQPASHFFPSSSEVEMGFPMDLMPKSQGERARPGATCLGGVATQIERDVLTFFSSSRMPSSTPFSSKSTRTALMTSWMMWS